MKRILTFFALAAMVMPVSCIKDDLAGPEMGNGSGKGMKFTAVMEVPGSKTAINVSDDGSVASVAWMAGDALKFDYAIGKTDSDPVISSNLAEEDIVNGSATFFAQIPQEFSLEEDKYTDKENPRYLYAAYPASLETTYTTAGNAYHLVIPTVQDGSFANASISVAKWNSAEPTAALEFKNLCGLISLTVGNNVRQIKLSSSGYIAGNANVGFDPVRVKNLTEGAASKEIIANVEGEGIYYIAVAPGTIKDLYIEFFDAEGNAVCDKLAKGDVTVERAHILPLGGFVEGSFAAQGGFFVKHDGKGDGSSWDNAADYTALHALLDNDLNGKTAEDARTMTVYMAAGTHSVSKQLNVTPAHNVKIYGGYPADAKGVSLSGRDVVANATIIDGGESCKIWNLTAGVWEISGLQFQNAKAADGSAITLKNNIAITCSDCTFKNNVATTTGAGAVYFYALGAEADVLFENCSFIGNKATKTDGSANTGLGGAVGSASTFKGGVVTFKNCLFKDNEAARNGGAMWVRTVHTRILDCNFIDNKAGTVTETGFGTQLHVDGSYALSVYCDGCYFSLNTLDLNSLVHTNNTSAESCLALNNCVVAGAWGAGGKVSVYNGGKGKLVLSNSTAFGQMGGIVKNTSTGSVSVLNCIVPHTTSSGMGNSFLNNGEGTFTVKKTLYSAVKSDQTFETEGNLDGIFVNSESEESNFPVNEKYVWYKGSSGGQRANNNTSKTAVDDVRGNVYYYAWDGAYPEGAEFTNATLTEVTALVKAADANFATWLGANSSDPNDNRLGKDIRGNARNAASMWPGSYQE